MPLAARTTALTAQISRQRRRFLVGRLVYLAVITPIVAVGIGALKAMFATSLPLGPAGIVLIVLLMVLVVPAVISSVILCFEAPRVVPYVEKSGGGDVHVPRRRYGRSLARSIELLDRIALHEQVTPLSTFGFNDDAFGQEVAWHDPGEGLRSIDALVERLRDDRIDRARGAQGLVDELMVLRHVLESAAREGRRFALIPRLGDDRYVSPLEMERRLGVFW